MLNLGFYSRESLGCLTLLSLLLAATACDPLVLNPFTAIADTDTTQLPLPANCLADDLAHDGIVNEIAPAQLLEDWGVCPCLVGEDPSLDPDGDGVPSACDPCPSDNPDDADGNGICDPNPTCWADINGDGEVDSLDSLGVTACWGIVMSSECLTTDFNGDGKVDQNDMDAVNDCWGSCPTGPGFCFDVY